MARTSLLPNPSSAGPRCVARAQAGDRDAYRAVLTDAAARARLHCDFGDPEQFAQGVLHRVDRALRCWREGDDDDAFIDALVSLERRARRGRWFRPAGASGHAPRRADRVTEPAG